MVSSVHHDLQDVFSKCKASSPALYWSYKPSPPQGRLSSLLRPELRGVYSGVMVARVHSVLHLTSKVGDFFMGRKHDDLHPCTDYWGLNKITINDHSALPLMNIAF